MKETAPAPHRIVSLAPSITEMLFAVGAGNCIVGVTSFCDYPPEARNIMRVGDHLSPNVEAIVRTDPDMVIMLPSTAQLRPALKSFGIETLVVRLESVDEIVAAIATIGQAVGRSQAVEELQGRITGKLLRKKQPQADDPPRVLVVVSHDAPTVAGFSSAYIAGQDGFYDRLIDLAGGTNAYDGILKYPQLSREGLLRLAPEILIDILADPEAQKITVRQVYEGWEHTFNGSVAKPLITVNTNDYAAIPGPRVVQLLEDFEATVRKE